MTAAAAMAGVRRETLHEWMRADHTLCEARDFGQSLLEGAVLSEAMLDGKLALDVLSRRSRAWQKRENVKLSGKVDTGGDASPDDIARKIALTEAWLAEQKSKQQEGGGDGGA